VTKVIELHEAVKESCKGRVHLMDLLRVGELIVQQLERGLDLRTAISHSAKEVYVRPQRDASTKEVQVLTNDKLLY